MNLAVLIPLSIGMGLIGLAAFFWALRNGQFDDPEGAAWRVLTQQEPLQKEGDRNGRLAAEPDHRNPRRGV
jgi:cbb3-type cytochrome oxidase maturation protein